MGSEKKLKVEKGASGGRHKQGCKICRHAERAEIEREWLNWGNTTRIAKRYGVSRDSLYRHAHAAGLFARRQRNLRRALERIIEQAETVPANATAVVRAIEAYARMNDWGQWLKPAEGVSLDGLFERMSREELEAYAKEGKLPDWFSAALGATPGDGQAGGNNG